jgi:hypothetical protein
MVTSRYAELVEVGKMAIKEEQIAIGGRSGVDSNYALRIVPV